jgi:hypothetical protein
VEERRVEKNKRLLAKKEEEASKKVLSFVLSKAKRDF